MQRLALGMLLALAASGRPEFAAAQQPTSMAAVCFPADAIAKERQAGGTVTEVFRDADGDPWLVIENNGGALVGVLLQTRGVFCAVGARPPAKKEGVPERGT